MIGLQGFWRKLRDLLEIPKPRAKRKAEREELEKKILAARADIHNELAIPLINSKGIRESIPSVFNQWIPIDKEHPYMGLHYLAHQSKYLTLLRFITEVGSPFAKHLHKDNVKYEILILNKGKIKYGTEGNEKIIKSGDYHIIQADLLHTYQALEKSHGYVFWVPGFKDKYNGERKSLFGL